MAMITNDWLPAIQGEFKKPYYRELFQFVKEEYSRAVIIRRQMISSMRCILHRLVK